MSRKHITDVLFFLSSLENTDLKNSVIDEIDDFATPEPDGIQVEYISSKKKSGNPVIAEEVKALLQKKYRGKRDIFLTSNKKELRIDSIPYKKSDTFYISFKQKPKVGKGGGVKTAIQEEGSAFILTQVLKKNKKFESAKDIINDTETYKGLEKIFGSTYKGKINEWVHSYFEHQKAFFKQFQPAQWDVFEHGGQDFMTFIKDELKKVSVMTVRGKVPVGKYETWNPADIWAVKDKMSVKKKIEDAIDGDHQTLTEFNNVLYKLIEQKKLIGLSLKKIDDKQTAKFKYVNVSPKDIEFAEVEKIEMKDIKIEIDTNPSKKDGMIQGAYVTFADYTTYIIRTPGDKFSNLKYESVIKGSGGKGGAAPVNLVEDLIESTASKKTFTNKHQGYPQTIEEFIEDNRDYKKMYNSLKKYIKGTTSYDQFESMIKEMFESDSAKRRAIAQSKLMQLNFFSDVMKADSEFWTDLLYMSLKVGKRFAPHGKLS